MTEQATVENLVNLLRDRGWRVNVIDGEPTEINVYTPDHVNNRYPDDTIQAPWGRAENWRWGPSWDYHEPSRVTTVELADRLADTVLNWMIVWG